MKYSELPNPSEPADSQRRIDAVLRVYKHIEDTKELSEDDKAEFFHCLYALKYRSILVGSYTSYKVLELASQKLTL